MLWKGENIQYGLERIKTGTYPEMKYFGKGISLDMTRILQWIRLYQMRQNKLTIFFSSRLDRVL